MQSENLNPLVMGQSNVKYTKKNIQLQLFLNIIRIDLNDLIYIVSYT